MLTVCWIGDPAGLNTAVDTGSGGRLDSESEPSFVNITGSGANTTSFLPFAMDVKEIEKNENIGRGDELPGERDEYGGCSIVFF